MKYATILLTAAVVLAAMMPTACAAPAKDPLLDMLPADTLFCVRINQFNTSLGKMDQYLTGASPLPFSLAMLAGMQMAGIVGDPMLTGIDREGTFAAVGMELDDKTIDMSIVVPMTDYEAFIKNNPNCKPSDTAGATLLAAQNSPVGALLMMPLPGGKYALVNSEDSADALVSLHTKLTAKTTALSASLDAGQTAQAAAAPLWAYLNVARLYALYGDMLIEAMETAMAEMPEQTAGEQALEMNRQMAAAMIKILFGQADSLTLALTPEPAILSLEKVFTAKKGTDLAALLTADPNAAKEFTLAGFASDSDAVNMVAKLNRPMLEKLNPLMLDIIKKAMAEKWTDADAQLLAALADKSLKAMGKEMFVSFSYGAGQPPFAMRQTVYVNTPDFVKQTADEGVAIANKLYTAMGLPMTLAITPDEESYMNTTISKVAVTLGNTDEPAAQAIAQMYGKDGLSYYTAQKDDLLFVTLAPNAKESIKAMIDAPQDKPAAGDLQKAMTILGDTAQKADLVAGVNYLKLAKGFMGMADQMSQTMGEGQTPPMLAAMASAMDVPTQSCMAAAATAADGKITARLMLPKQHLSEIMNAVMKVQQLMIQQQMQEQPAPQPLQNGESSAEDTQDPLQSWIGKPAPALQMVDMQGKKYTLAELKGKKVVLDFWATWCPPCKKMIPELNTLRDQLKADDVVILGLSDEPIDRLNKFTKDNKMNYPIISYGQEMPIPFSAVTGLPTTFLIDAQGVIRNVLVGYHTTDELKAALGEMK